MAENETLSKLLIDEILDDAKVYSGKKSDIKSWSLDEIDALLAGGKNAKGEAKPMTTARAEVSEQSLAEEKMNSLREQIMLKEQAMKDALKEDKTETIFKSKFQYNYEDNKEPIAPKKKPSEVPGQITIEKTRTFNEIERGAVHNDKIKHKIGADKVIKSNKKPSQKPVMETDKYRERFLNRPQMRLEKTQEHKDLLDVLPPKTIERPGIIVKNNPNDKTIENDLSPVPTIISAEDALAEGTAADRKPARGLEEQIKDQIMLDGFVPHESIDQVDEFEEEMKLIKTRREKAKKFKLFPNLPNSDNEPPESYEETFDVEQTNQPDEKTRVNIDVSSSASSSPDSEDEHREKKKKTKKKKPHKEKNLMIDREYFGPRDAQAVYDIFDSEKRKALAKFVTITGYMMVLAVCASFVSLTGNFSLFGNSEFAYISCSILLLLAGAIINIRAVKVGFKDLFSGEMSVRAGVVIATIIGIIQCITAFFFETSVESTCHLYAAVAMLPMALLNIGEFIKVKGDISAFLLLCDRYGDLYTINKVENDNDAFEIGRGLLLTDPDIRYGAKTPFLSKFVEMTKSSEPADSFSKILIPIALVLGLIIGIACGVVTKNIFSAVSAATGMILLGIPSACLLSSSSILKNANKALRSDGAIISGHYAVEDAITANAVCVDAADLFHFGGSNLYGIKTFYSMRIDEAILYTAAVVIYSGGALSEVFDGVILGKRDVLPAVESLAYEEKLGCSGWIYNHRVLVGSRDLLSKHNVEVPSIEEENKYRKDDRQLLYLAVEGKIAAMFVVGYQVNKSTSKYIKKLEKYGASVLVRTSDPNITEELIEDYFDLPSHFIKIINPIAGEIFKDLYREEEKKAPCLISYNGKIKSFFRAFSSAFIIEEKLKISKILQIIGISISMVMMAVLSFVSGLDQAGVMQILLFQVVWMFVVLLISKFKKV